MTQVNISPALGATSELDKVLKCKLISDILHLLGVRAPPVKRDNNAPKKGVSNELAVTRWHVVAHETNEISVFLACSGAGTA